MPGPGTSRIRFLLLPVLVILSNPTAVLAQPPDSTPSRVGEKLPLIKTERWYVGQKMNIGSLRGQRWVLALVKVGEPALAQIQPLLESVHRPRKEGGPVILLLTKQGHEEILKAFRSAPRPKIPLASDRRMLTHMELKVAVFPYFFIVGPDGRVEAQGPASNVMAKKIMDLRKGGAKEAPPAGGSAPEPPAERPKLPADYREQVEKALSAPAL